MNVAETMGVKNLQIISAVEVTLFYID